MADYEFWAKWNETSELEKGAIESLNEAKRLILENIPEEEIISIYAKGSLVRRELNEKSDVDTLTILKHSKWLPKLKELHDNYRDKYNPKLDFSGYTLWELRRDKKTNKNKDLRPSPSRTLQHLDHYELIYGKELEKENFKQGSDEERLKGMIDAFQNIFLPKYRRDEFNFSELIKQVFWLVENEQRMKEREPSHNWEELASDVEDGEHIIHDALKFRRNIPHKEWKRGKFIKKLESYLSEIRKLFE